MRRFRIKVRWGNGMTMVYKSWGNDEEEAVEVVLGLCDSRTKVLEIEEIEGD